MAFGYAALYNSVSAGALASVENPGTIQIDYSGLFMISGMTSKNIRMTSISNHTIIGHTVVTNEIKETYQGQLVVINQTVRQNEIRFDETTTYLILE